MRRLSKCQFTQEQDITLKTLVYMRTWDGSQNASLHKNKILLSKHWSTWEHEMALKTLVYSAFNHLTQLLAQESFTELSNSYNWISESSFHNRYVLNFSLCCYTLVWKVGTSQTHYLSVLGVPSRTRTFLPFHHVNNGFSPTMHRDFCSWGETARVLCCPFTFRMAILRMNSTPCRISFTVQFNTLDTGWIYL